MVVPTLLTNREQMERAVRDLEIRFLGNRDANLHFALLTDPPDAATQFDKRDELAAECARLIQELNRRYAPEGKAHFFCFTVIAVSTPAKKYGWAGSANAASFWT